MHTVFNKHKILFTIVVSTIEPGRKQVDSENGDSMNGDALLDVSVDVEMDKESSSSSSTSSDREEDDAAYKTTVSATATDTEPDTELFKEDTEPNEAASDKDTTHNSLPANRFDAGTAAKDERSEAAKLIDIEGHTESTAIASPSPVRDDNDDDALLKSTVLADDADDLHINVVDVVKDKDIDPMVSNVNDDDDDVPSDTHCAAADCIPDNITENIAADEQSEVVGLHDLPMATDSNLSDDLVKTADETKSVAAAATTTDTLCELTADTEPCLEKMPVEALVLEATQDLVCVGQDDDDKMLSTVNASDDHCDRDDNDDDEYEPKSAKIQRLNDTCDTSVLVAPSVELAVVSPPQSEPPTEIDSIDVAMPTLADDVALPGAKYVVTVFHPIETIISSTQEMLPHAAISELVTEAVTPGTSCADADTLEAEGNIEPVEILAAAAVPSTDDIDLGAAEPLTVLPTIEESSLEMLPDVLSSVNVVVSELFDDAKSPSIVCETVAAATNDQQPTIADQPIAEPVVSCVESTSAEAVVGNEPLTPQIEIKDIAAEPSAADTQPDSTAVIEEATAAAVVVVVEPVYAAPAAAIDTNAESVVDVNVAERMAVEETLGDAMQQQPTTGDLEHVVQPVDVDIALQQQQQQSTIVAETAIVENAMESAPIIPAANEDEQMEVDESNSIDSMDL